MTDRKAVILSVAILLLAYGFERVARAVIYREKELLACRAFVTANDAVAREFGPIRKFRPGGLADAGRRFRGSLSGDYNFCVTGTRKRGYLHVSWSHQDGDVVVTRISMPLGFWKEAAPWPEDRESHPGCPPSSHVWHGLAYLLGAFVSAVIVAGVVLGAKPSSRLADLLPGGTTRGVVFLAGACNLVYAAVMSGRWFLQFCPG